MAAVLEIRLTHPTDNSNSDPNQSLGGITTNTQLSSTPLNNLFDDVTYDEATNGDEEYRAIDIINTGDATATLISMWTTDTTSPDTHLELGVENDHDSFTNPHDPSTAGETVADESTAPTNVTSFSQYDFNNRLSIPDLDPNKAYRVWIKRVVNSGAGNMSNDNCDIKIEYA